jgi:hypothetical protein
VEYLTGLTSTGAAIDHMVKNGFSGERGARLKDDTVSKVAIIITDGRSQDEVIDPSARARQAGITMFVIGVTDHIKQSELEEIAGDREHTFHVDEYADLNQRLRSLVQKAACPTGPSPTPAPNTPCDPTAQTGCDRALNELCSARANGTRVCECPDKFSRHPLTRVCGGQECNPNVPSTCPWPEECVQTHLRKYLCSCPPPYTRNKVTGKCGDGNTTESRICRPGDAASCDAHQQCTKAVDGHYTCVCVSGFQWHDNAKKCVQPGYCERKEDCDARKKEQCLPSSQGFNQCACPTNFQRHPVSELCRK